MWIMDFEASGLSKKSYPIEVGVTNGSDSEDFLIKPMSHWTFWNADAESTHGISKSELNTKGVDSLEVVKFLNKKLNNSIVYCDSINWDGFWLNVLFSDRGITPSFKLLDIHDLLETDHIFEKYIKAKTGLINSGAYKEHRALDDAKVIYQSLAYALNL